MTKFEIGKTYYDTSACNHECVYTVEIISRTEKTVTYLHNGTNKRRSKIRVDRDGEYIIPDSYSMAPVFRATREIQPEADTETENVTETIEETAETAAATRETATGADTSVVQYISQQIEGGNVVMVGQRVEMNCGAMYPTQDGVIIGFVDVPEQRFSRGGVHAVIKWEGRDKPELTELGRIHPRGWRSAGGSPLGIFLAR